MSPLFLAAIEATEEAIYNSMFRATTTTGHGDTVEAPPIHKTTDILRRYGAIKRRTTGEENFCDIALFPETCADYCLPIPAAR
jgi:Peptidase family S58